MKAEERHHLQTNEFAVRMAWVAEQLTTNLNRILTIAGIVVVAGAIVGAYFYMQKQSADQASAELGAALTIHAVHNRADVHDPWRDAGGGHVPDGGRARRSGDCGVAEGG
jgi:hypothetical protein